MQRLPGDAPTDDHRSCRLVAATVCAGMDVVFHCATAAPSASNAVSNEKLMYDVNVVGTEHVIWACQQLGIPKLVYTSSASVVFEGRDLLDVDESAPYAKPMDFYTNTKARPTCTRT